ncbi:class I SAM-dependent methyltransferase [Glacieibacterium frigidum]|uniref:Methyltransferase domain-containing protein n=1 Tax=Glacieibacterium frigidum TaxID=2593303 RepID=A0A552UEY6_9SPHN|nr:methyltransferase domain-containing protein [Glacieibacterium frigidum]TRW16780.1 methyltransferase domain-containing protein [Glacieibacterium frigidum]
MAQDIFNRRARRAHARRADLGRHGFLRDALADGIADRLSVVRRDFTRVLDIGGAMGARLPGALRLGLTHGDVIGEEDRLPFADASFDLVVSAGVLQGVGDLPGALLLARRVLAPDGLFVASFFAGATLGEVRADLLAAEIALTGRVAARTHPAVDPREGGALLQRAGFALPVADIDTLTVRYDHLFALLADVRGMGEGNALTQRAPLRRDVLADAAARFAARAGPDGRIAVNVDVVTLTGWAPAPSQPQPLARGSGKVSLARALNSRV